MATTAVFTQIHALLERPSPSKSEESTLTYLNSRFASLDMLNDVHGFRAVVEQAVQQDEEFTDQVSTNDATRYPVL